MVLKVGQVFHLQCGACTPPKPKFHVLARIDPDPRFFLINSAPTAYQLARPHLMSSMLQVTRAELKFLAHPSWLDCSVLMGGYTAATLETLVSTSNPNYLDRMASPQRRAVRAIVSASKLLSGADKTAMLALW